MTLAHHNVYHGVVYGLYSHEDGYEPILPVTDELDGERFDDKEEALEAVKSTIEGLEN